ncbi:MAG: rhodanese-related sulfurtransferase [Rickettsiales bacterium]
MSAITVQSFYSFTAIAEPRALRATLLARMQTLGVRGTITLAGEGVNATISGAADAVEALLATLRAAVPGFAAELRTSHTEAQPFQRSKVKVKPELISLGVAAHPAQCVGRYVSPADWNALITCPDVMIIDTRNDFESQLGHFQGALNPGTRSFKQMVAFTETTLLPDTHRPVAMYCTGGIRCEKYSSYLVGLGFAQVYHLRGGILAYLETVPKAESLWQGECFVFDARVSVA